MIAFEVKLNGKVLCTAGIGEFGYLFVDLLWDKGNPAHRPKGQSKKAWGQEELLFQVSGGRVLDEHFRERLEWASLSLSAGDRIAIRIVERRACDEPSQRLTYAEGAPKTIAPANRAKGRRSK